MPINRRRFIFIAAAAAGVGIAPFGRAAERLHTLAWEGHLLGAAGRMQIHHHDRAAAEQLVEQALAEVRRLEAVFSLYRDDSALSLLNRQGVIVAPPTELVDLLRQSQQYRDLTGGAFDPTIQPLWALYADHFARSDADPRGPSAEERAAALARVGLDHVIVDPDRIAFTRRGMAISLNGIAQGFVTDRVVEILRAGGIGQSLVDMGEISAIGRQPDGSAWRVGIADPGDPSRVGEHLLVADQAVATSGGYGFEFDRHGNFSHLFDPRTGHAKPRHRSVTTIMPTATAADALSTAFNALSIDEIGVVLKGIGGRAHLVTAAGERVTI